MSRNEDEDRLVRKMCADMTLQLLNNRKRGGWRKVTADELIVRAMVKLAMIRESGNVDRKALRLWGADVANLVAMVMDNMGCYK